jgi:hypothetical protein
MRGRENVLNNEKQFLQKKKRKEMKRKNKERK